MANTKVLSIRVEPRVADMFAALRVIKKMDRDADLFASMLQREIETLSPDEREAFGALMKAWEKKS